MRDQRLLAVSATAMALAAAQPALAKPGDPIAVGDGITVDPIIDVKLRYEHVDTPTLDADAATARVQAGAEVKANKLSVLAEAEGTLAVVDDYNAFPFAVASGQRRPQFATVADPANVELNRLQIQYRDAAVSLTVGRQRIIVDDQRWVGNAGWRQNEQTFDAVRAEAKLGPISLDGTYAIDQRTIYGIDGEARQGYSGDFVLLGAGTKLGLVNVRAFAYLLDYDEAVVFANSSLTVGGKVTAALPLSHGLKLALMASYARQSDYGRNPVDYAADYIAAEAGLSLRGLTLRAGWESLGSDADAAGGTSRAVQTPLATLHKFNGWADMFLTTPNKGLHDLYFGAAYKFDGVKALPGLNAALTWHRYDSDVGSTRYGDEWNASLGFKLGPVAVLGKYASYNAKAFGVDTEKMWLQLELGY